MKHERSSETGPTNMRMEIWQSAMHWVLRAWQVHWANKYPVAPCSVLLESGEYGILQVKKENDNDNEQKVSSRENAENKVLERYWAR